MRREVRRAAWFLWMRPFDAALPRRFCARRTASGASSAPVSIAVAAVFTRVFSSERTPWLRRRRRSFERFRLIWLLMFAMARAVLQLKREGEERAFERPLRLAAEPGFRPNASRAGRMGCARARSVPQLQHRRPRRPREVDAGRPHR